MPAEHGPWRFGRAAKPFGLSSSAIDRPAESIAAAASYRTSTVGENGDGGSAFERSKKEVLSHFGVTEKMGSADRNGKWHRTLGKILQRGCHVSASVRCPGAR
jgi:hypothetical protein